MMRATLVLVARALASEEVVFADDEAVSLLQLSSKHSEAYSESLDLELQAVDTEDDAIDQPDIGRPRVPRKDVHSMAPFGPDGTWNTPYCKDIQGCIPYCPPGCNGGARWMWPLKGNSRLGVPRGGPNSVLRHFEACEQGKKLPGPVGSWNPRTAFMNCLGSENSTKAPILPPEWDAMKDHPQYGEDRRFWYPNMRGGYEVWSMTPYGYEYCPVDCVNDCAFFQNGNFNHCGVTGLRGWTGYNRGNGPEVGPTLRCNTDYTWGGEVHAYLWCGERTTTTTTTTTTTEALPPPEVEPEVDPEDDAEATGDPHMTTNTGHHFDMVMPEP
jgi:hypothetical protein